MNSFVIGIAGGTGSGKTTVVEEIVSQTRAVDICVISQDAYYQVNDHIPNEERSHINFDHPNAIDFKLLTEHIKTLKQGKSIEQPTYSFIEHNRTHKTKTIAPKNVIIVEGILIFNSEALRNLCDVKIFVQADADERLIRRIRRDTKERGRTITEVLSRYQSTIKPMHKMFVEPTKIFADMIIPNDRKNDIAINMITSIINEHL